MISIVPPSGTDGFVASQVKVQGGVDVGVEDDNVLPAVGKKWCDHTDAVPLLFVEQSVGSPPKDETINEKEASAELKSSHPYRLVASCVF